MEPHPQIPRRILGVRKVMLVTFFDSKGLVYREFVCQPRTVNQLTFRQTVTRFDIAFQNWHPHRSVGGCHFIHMDNVPAHITALTRQHLANLGWTVLPHPACSPDLAPNDFWYYPCLKAGIKGQRFDILDDLEQAVDEQIGAITAQEYEQCILVKWPSRWRKCLTQQGHYFEGVVGGNKFSQCQTVFVLILAIVVSNMWPIVSSKCVRVSGLNAPQTFLASKGCPLVFGWLCDIWPNAKYQNTFHARVVYLEVL